MMLFTMETPDYQKLAATIEELSRTKKVAETAKEEAEQAKEAILQKKSIQDYYSAQAKMARALGRLRAKREGKL